MRLFFKTLALTLVFSVALSVPIWAGESGQKPLNEVFDSIAVVPVDYHDKVFLNGQKTDVLGDYQIHQRNGRVLVPVRLMGYLMAGTGNSHCEVIWDPQKPEDVTLINQGLKQRVKLTVNSNTMYINDEPQALDVPPQKINGRIVLPLRSASQALGKNVQWFDGLVFISDGVVGLESPQTTEIVEQIKKKLSDERKELAYEKKVTPVIKYGDTVYYTKTIYDQGGQTEELYKKTSAGAEMKVELPGEKRFGRSKIFNGELYYLAKINGNSELHIFNFAGNKWRKLCDLEQWNPGDGWLAGMELIDNEFYVVLHFGDLTMGYETLYKLENGVLREIAGAKSFIDFDVEGGFLYYTDFHPMNWTENLFRVNMETGEKETLGEKDFTCGISRTIQNQGGTSYSSNSAFYIKNGYIYTLGYKESDGEDRASVYKISLDGKTRDKLTPPVRTFWLVDNEIYYIDLDTGYLLSVDTEGNNKKTLVDRSIIDLKFFKENIYYTAGRNNGTDARLGELYKYDIPGGNEIKLSDKLVSEFLIGETGIYYKAEGYDLGLYKVDENGTNVCLVDDSIDSFLLTDTGVVYTMRYMEGIYTAK